MRATVIQATWTPHSEARLGAAIEHFSDGGDHLEVVSLSATQSDYGQWPPPSPERRVLFPETDYWQIPSNDLEQWLSASLAASDPNVVVVAGWAFRESRLALRWSLDRSVPCVVISDSFRGNRRRLHLEMFKRAFVANIDAAFVAGTPHVGYLEALGLERERCFTGCDVVDNAFFAGRPVRRPGPPTLLSCIRLLPGKNVPLVLDALARCPGWHWRIAGEGPERKAIEGRIAALGLADRVELLGNVSYGDLPKLYASADVYIQPSLSDTWGLAVNEAMAAGLPVLVSDRCGCSVDLVDPDGNGFRFDPTRSSSLESALVRMLGESARWTEMGSTSRDIISGWGLDLYATNLRLACETASATPRRRRIPARALGRLF